MEIVKIIDKILSDKKLQSFDETWYRSLLSGKEMGLSLTFSTKKFYAREIIQLAAEPDDDIPPYKL